MQNNLYTLNYNQIMKMRIIKNIIKDNKDSLSDYELLTLHDLLYFISKDRKAITANKKLIHLFKKENMPMQPCKVDRDIYVLHEGTKPIKI